MEIETAEMFVSCPKCEMNYLIIYSNNSRHCTYCGFRKTGK